MAAAAIVCSLATLSDNASARNTLVFAAASTADALNATLARYTEKTGLAVRVAYASSGALARQIDHGAPAALFVSANAAWMTWLDDRSRLARSSRAPLFGNQLVLIQPKRHVVENRAVPVSRDIRENILRRTQYRFAIANPAHVPAGTYAKEALTAIGLWSAVSAIAVRTRDVRASLLLVERGEAALGIVYKTDAERSDKVSIINTFPKNTHKPIRYHLAIVEEQDNRATRRLYTFLQSRPAKVIFDGFGFDTKTFHGPVKPR